MVTVDWSKWRLASFHDKAALFSFDVNRDLMPPTNSATVIGDSGFDVY